MLQELPLPGRPLTSAGSELSQADIDSINSDYALARPSWDTLTALTWARDVDSKAALLYGAGDAQTAASFAAGSAAFGGAAGVYCDLVQGRMVDWDLRRQVSSI